MELEKLSCLEVPYRSRQQDRGWLEHSALATRFFGIFLSLFASSAALFVSAAGFFIPISPEVRSR